MADNNEKETEHEWEVLNATASTYAAAPGPARAVGSNVTVNEDPSRIEHGSSSTHLITPDLHVFPPNEHEDLPIEPFDESIFEKEGFGGTIDAAANDNIQSLGEVGVDNPQTIQFYNEGVDVSARPTKLAGAEFGYKAILIEGADDDNGADEAVHEELTPPREYSYGGEEDKSCDLGFPHKAWWKKRASSLYHQAKESNTFWPVIVAAALVGLVILGQKWQRDRTHLRQLKWYSSCSSLRG